MKLRKEETRVYEQIVEVKPIDIRFFASSIISCAFSEGKVKFESVEDLVDFLQKPHKDFFRDEDYIRLAGLPYSECGTYMLTAATELFSFIVDCMKHVHIKHVKGTDDGIYDYDTVELDDDYYKISADKMNNWLAPNISQHLNYSDYIVLC